MSDLKKHFTRTCPACEKEGTFVPELLFRRCLQSWTRSDIVSARNEPSARRDYVSEPARFLLNDSASARYTFGDPARNRQLEADEDDRVDVIFAAVCPNIQCKSPILLRVAGPKGDFARIMRKRAGLPNGMAEEDLRLLHPDELAELSKPNPDFKYSLELLDTLPRSAEKDTGRPWCDVELGPLCRAIDELEPAKLKASSETQVRASALSLISAMLVKLEVKKLVLQEFSWLARRERSSWPWMLSLSRWLSGKKPLAEVKAICDAARRESKSVAEAVDLFLMGHSLGDQVPTESLQGVMMDRKRELEKTIQRSLDDPKFQRGLKPRSIGTRLESLYLAGLVPREVWRWAMMIQQKASGLSDSRFVDVGTKEEIAAFVRTLAQRAFEHPYVAAQAIASHAETADQQIPKKERKLA